MINNIHGSCLLWSFAMLGISPNRNVMAIICKYTKIQTKTQETISLALEVLSLANKISYFIISKDSNYTYSSWNQLHCLKRRKNIPRKTRHEESDIHFPVISLLPHKRETSTEKKSKNNFPFFFHVKNTSRLENIVNFNKIKFNLCGLSEVIRRTSLDYTF